MVRAAKKVKRRKSSELGLGDAVTRLTDVLFKIRATPKSQVNERLEFEKESLTRALNIFTVDLGFECRFDPSEDVYKAAEEAEGSTPLELIKAGSTTSCCRILSTDHSRQPANKPKRGRPRNR